MGKNNGITLIRSLKFILNSFDNDQAREEEDEKDKEVSDEKDKKLVEMFKQLNEESNRLIGWALLIIGGSVLALLQKDYFQLDGWYKCIYSLFILGWLFLCSSIYYGELITRNYLASIVAGKEVLSKINTKINLRFSKQISHFRYGVIMFAIWMVLFLLLRIFNPENAIYHERM